MPPISSYYLHSSIYLYPSEQNALDGARTGGSGFLIHVPIEGHEGWGTLYAVTNKHVLDEGALYIRLSTKGGGVDVLPTERDSWYDHPERYDVSVLPLDLGESHTYEYVSFSTDEFISREIIEDWKICPGDEAFLIGRLITPWGQQRNVPAVRFGNISMMADPNELMIGHGNVPQEAFYVECRSLSGFSGSPVFVTTTRHYDKETAPKKYTHKEEPEPETEQGKLKVEFVGVSGTFGPWLLGIDMGHLPLWKPVYESDRETKTEHQVEQNTGIACVIPAWHILDLLNDQELVKERERDKRDLDSKRENSNILDRN
jgi:hypothetical protein